jgi:hypothetical protein
LFADWNCGELVAGRFSLGSNRKPPLGCGSGQLGMPWVRMHPAYDTSAA